MAARKTSRERSPAMNRRVDGVERKGARGGRTRFIFRDIGETDDMLQARIRAEIASGEASEDDRFVTFAWLEPEDDLESGP
jgi:hypothetical protein